MIAAMTMTVPRSFPNITNAITKPAPGTTGMMTCIQRWRSFCLRARTAAIQTQRISLAISEGWRVTPPMSIQFLLPLTVLPMTCTKASRTMTAPPAPTTTISSSSSRWSVR